MSDISKLPSPETYEQEYEYWPWGDLISYVSNWLLKNAPIDSCIVDYMCGTGFLMNKMVEIRSDLKVYGCSITEDFIHYAQKKYTNINVTLEDALEYHPPLKPNIIVATGGIHHLTYEKQILFIKKVASELSTGDYFIVGEELIREYKNESERKISAFELISNLINYVLRHNPPEPVLKAALNLIEVDIFKKGEYKLSLSELENLLTPYFLIENMKQIWPLNSEPYGDFVLICKRK